MTDLATVENSNSTLAVSAPQMSRAALMRAQIESETEIRKLVGEYINAHMVVDTDYGVIPGTKKPTLLKPGAEKLVDLFNVEPSYEVVARVEDWDRGLFHYEIRCQLKERGTGIVRAEGMGSANSREGRYRWRQGERACPNCGKATIIKGKAEYGGGWICFAKKGGCGAKFADKDPSIVEQIVGKIENDDIYTLVNTILKMAKKRCLVDAAIALARCSDRFTQDVEDIVDAHGEEIDHEERAHQGRQRQSKSKTQDSGEKRRPKFSKSAQWSGTAQWGGRPLDEAPLDTLLDYYQVAKDAIEREEDARIVPMLREHLRHIEDAIADKEPKPEQSA